MGKRAVIMRKTEVAREREREQRTRNPLGENGGSRDLNTVLITMFSLKDRMKWCFSIIGNSLREANAPWRILS